MLSSESNTSFMIQSLRPHAHSIARCLRMLAIPMLLGACASYQPKPLDRSAVMRELTPPSMETLRLKAKEIRHPILKPIQIDLHDGLSPDEAAILAVLANPTVRAARDKRGVANAQLLQAGILPNPQFTSNVDVPTGNDTQGTVNAYGLVLSWDIRQLISRNARIGAAQNDVASVDLNVAWQEWQVAEAAKLHVYRLVFLEKQLAVARESERGLQENRDAVKQAVALGDMTSIDLSSAEAALQAIRLTVATTEQAKEKERLTLNQTLGLPPDKIIPLEKKIEIPSVQHLPSVAKIIEGIEERRLDLLALKKGYESQEERLRAAVLAQFPRINIGLSRARDTGNVVTTGFSIAIDLPVFDRNQGQIAIETATRTQLFDEYLARLFQARSDVATILADMASIQSQIETTEKYIPTLKELVQSYHRALLEGGADVLTYYSALNELITRQIDALKLKQILLDQMIALEIASGEYLPGKGVKEGP
jgi:cobalt-zinc-cadmium efflux system outer membrane protein